MGYKPKSKLNIKQTAGREFVLKSKQTRPDDYYIGDYIEMSNGKYYAGKNILYTKDELIKPNSETNNFGSSMDVQVYKRINKKPLSILRKVDDIFGHKNKPTENDYSKGYYTRYFVKKVNEQFGYIEVNKKVYQSIERKNGKYDYNLYDVGNLYWSLIGNVFKTNQLNVKRKERIFPFLSTLFPLYNEFHKPDVQLQENITTNGGELYYHDGKEYIGSYHIHPTRGPMEGATHTQEPHKMLYYTNTLPITQTKRQKFDVSEDAFAEFQKQRALEELIKAKEQALKDEVALSEEEKKIKDALEKLKTSSITTNNNNTYDTNNTYSSKTSGGGSSGGGGGGY